MKHEIHELAGNLRTTYQQKINNTHIWASIAYEAINLASANAEILSSNKFKVPSRESTKIREINRTKEKLEEILNSAAETDFNYSIFTFLVSLVEAFFSDLISGVLKIDKRRLKTKVQGIDHVNRIDVSEIIDSDNIEDVIEHIINKEMIGIFYASPEKQFEYIEKVIGITFDSKLTDLSCKWKEYKATRDIIIHNSGTVNDLYIKKTGNCAKWNVGESIKIDQDYLNGLVAESKSLIGKICTLVQNKNKA